MIARVLTKRESARAALAIASLVVFALGAIVFDDLTHVRLFMQGPSTAVYALVASLIGLGGVAPWLAWTRRGDARDVRCATGEVHLGKTRVLAADVTALAIAEAARGRSVAIACGSDVIFVEVERAEDAARIAEALGGEKGEIPLRRRSRVLAIPQALGTTFSAVAAPLYFLVAVGIRQGFVDWLPAEGKAFWGLGGVLAAVFALALLVVRRLIATQDVALRRGAYDAHVSLHEAARREGERARVASDTPVRVGTLERGDEGVGAWLTRLDALPVEAHAYRGDAMKKDVLWDMLGDAGAPVDARMAAARVLSRRYGEEERALVRVVDDRDVRVRVEAALEEEQEDAERRIQTLGPLFRAR